MKTIAKVAIAALDKFADELNTTDTYQKFHPLWLAWMQIRSVNGFSVPSTFKEWLDEITRELDHIKDSYIRGDSYMKRLRYQYTESANLRVTLNIMGGFKGEYCQWETECFVSIVA
jgi:hypothetical protein